MGRMWGHAVDVEDNKKQRQKEGNNEPPPKLRAKEQ